MPTLNATGDDSGSAASDALVQGASVADEQTVLLHLDDSVLDVKRMLQQTFREQWGLRDRPLDRHGLMAGWELLHDESALSYHLFMHDYGIEHGGLLHVVVRRNGT